MANKKSVFVTACVCVLMYACTKDFIETNLSGKKISLISPADNLHTTTLVNTFWWSKIDGATTYNLQVVKPGFSSIQQLLLDTNVAGDHFSYTFIQPGTYQWRVNGFNASSKTDYSANYTLIIDSTSSLNGQSVILVSPVNATNTNYIGKIQFKWDSIYIASDYRFQIINDSFPLAPIVDVIVSINTFTYSLTEGAYTWRVKAENATSLTLFSSRTYTVDVTPPPVSLQVLPANGDTIVTHPDTLTWTRSAQTITDSLFIYQDSVIYTPVVSAPVANMSYIFNGTVNKKYYWRLKSGDSAGNWSSFGSLRKFKVK